MGELSVCDVIVEELDRILAAKNIYSPIVRDDVAMALCAALRHRALADFDTCCICFSTPAGQFGCSDDCEHEDHWADFEDDDFEDDEDQDWFDDDGEDDDDDFNPAPVCC